MSKSVASLSVHRNTVEKRRKRELAHEVETLARDMVRDRDIRAYAIVGIGADGRAYCRWDTGAIMPMWAFADTIGNALRRDMEDSDVEEDWRPALTPRGST